MMDPLDSHMSAAADPQSSKLPEVTTANLQVEYPDDPSIITRFTNYIRVVPDQSGYFLTFYENRPPFLGTTNEEGEAALRAVKPIRAESVCRLYVPRESMEGMLNAIKGVFERRTAIDEAFRKASSGGAC